MAQEKASAMNPFFDSPQSLDPSKSSDYDSDIGASVSKVVEELSESLETLVVFGDSYSTSQYGDSKTWVDFAETHVQSSELGLTIHNFAFPGATAKYDLESEISLFFDSFPPKSLPQSQFSLDPERTCYVIFFGINDCGSNSAENLEGIVQTLLDTIHKLFIQADARRFVVADVPPMDRSPRASLLGSEDVMRTRVETWNGLLHAQISKFAGKTRQASISELSVHAVFADLLNDYEDGDEGDDDLIWSDGLHATELVHESIADRLMDIILPK